jgi:CubicO group peptidase (beta-lactamase class C family)
VLAAARQAESPALSRAVEAGFALVEANIAGGGVPGAVLGVVDRAGNRAIRHAGRAAIEPQPAAMRADSWFDLASLTKVIFTTTAILKAWEAGRIDLDAPLTSVIPDFRQQNLAAPERNFTFRQCLSHRTSLPASYPFYTLGGEPERLKALILQHDWPVGPPVYSDLNFILLGIALERLAGRPLDRMPVAPGFAFRPDPARTAATERCPWRGRVMRGQVHDENAYALGGMAGHAGLFGTIDGVLGFAHGLMSGGVLGDRSLAAIRTRTSPGRSLGWQMRSEGWPGGGGCSMDTIGHTGFTGTAMWVDFERGLGWALLTNRVHPSRFRETGIAALRVAVSEAVVRA